MLCLGTGRAAAADLPQRSPDLDLVVSRRAGPTRARWFFRPSDVPLAESALLAGQSGVIRIGILSMFDDRWILEAPADSVVAVESSWSSLGELSADESGEAALLDATELVGADADFRAARDFEGEVTTTVAILDSGCDTAHNDLGDPDTNNVDGFPDAGDIADWSDAGTEFAGELILRVVGWHDVTDDLPLAVGPWDDHFHGTAMASAAFGSGTIDPTLRGVAPQGRFVVVKTWNFEGRWERWASDFFLGVEWLLQNADRLQVQACVTGTVWREDHGFAAAVEALRQAGIVCIAPTGNSGGPVGWPALVPGALGVGAASPDGRLAAYSATATGLTVPPVVDFLAPGGTDLSVDGGVLVADNEPDDTYRRRVGTSISAAIVGGAVSVLAEASIESGAPWPAGPDRVERITGILSATALELAAAEPGSAETPRLDRGAVDRQEGYGLVQVDTAVDAVSNVIWPGDLVTVSLGDPRDGRATWAARIPHSSTETVTLSLFPASSVDADLYVYRDTGVGLVFLQSSTRSGWGVAESVDLEYAPLGDLVVVAKRVSGAGTVVFDSLQRFGTSSLWPRELRSTQLSAPAIADLDGDGSKEIILTNTFEVDRRVHEFVIFDARGRTFRFFPRSVDSTPWFGSLTAPVVARIGGRQLIVAGSTFGQVFALTDSGQTAFQVLLTPGLPIRAPVVWEEGPGGRLLVSTQGGVQVLLADGSVERLIVLSDVPVGDVAVGDLDGDGQDDVVVATADGAVHAVSIDGTALPGWPVFTGGVPGSPVLIGSQSGATVTRVLVPVSTGTGDVFLEDRGPDGQPMPGSPQLLDRGSLPVLGKSPMAAAWNGSGQAEVVVTTALGGLGTDQVLRLHRYQLSTGSVPGTLTTEDRVVSRKRLKGLLHFGRALVLDEPRMAELSSSPGLEILQLVQMDWNEAFVGNPRRYGSLREVMVWPRGGKVPTEAVSPGHELFPEVWGLSPVIADLDEDGYPDWIVVRGNRVYRAGGQMRGTLSGAWTRERSDAARSGCLDCQPPLVVAAPGLRTRLSVSASPNPFNPRTLLRATVPASGRLRWSVFDARGRRVRGWVGHAGQPGLVEEEFDALDQDGKPLGSGVYFVQVQQATARATTRIVLVR